MGQDEVLKVLRKAKKLLNSNQIKEKTKLSTVQCSLMKLHKHKAVKRYLIFDKDLRWRYYYEAETGS